MLGWNIFAHSLRMVFGNLKQVAQIVIGPAIIGTVAIIGVFMVSGIPLEAFDDNPNGLPPGVNPGALILFAFLLFVVMLLVMGWIAVAWHRYILLEEYPSGVLPTFRFDRILAYFGRGLMLGILMAIAFLPMGILTGMLGEGLIAVSIILTIGYLVFLAICFYRLSIILPAAAIGQPITLSEAWSNTLGTAGTIIVLIVVSFLFQFLVQLAIGVLSIIPVLGVLIALFFGILILPMINVSILTTMYGVFIEKRELG
ncbi:hypothetical protein [Ruegeria arenilitoris]|uniref:hypothetical protein n=1 Tax=Ruegeria arenilitoris TaxID=1173585 RepID=UPI00147FE839|nr:hypothetical protein [Ruegeria arenilitoris]